MKVSVIIATYRDTVRLHKCIKSLDNQTFSSDKFEVIIVNNDAKDGVEINFTHSLNLIVLVEHNPGSYIARNTGISYAKGEILAFTDSDAIPERNWIEKGIVTFTKSNNNKVIVAGKVQLTYENENSLSLAECYEKYFAFPHQRVKSKTLSGVVAGNVFIRSETFKEIGSFNGKLLSGGDSEFSQRALQHDYVINYNPECVVYHPSKFRIADLLNKRKRIFGGKVYRKIYVEKQSKILSISQVLTHQIKRYLNELIQVFKIHVDRSVSDRIKLIITILLIFTTLFYESVAILLFNRVRRR